MAYAVEPAWQAVQQEAADELVGDEGDDLLPVDAGAAVVLVAERDAALVEPDEPTLRDGDPPIAAVGTSLDVTAHGRGAEVLDRRHDL